jgi:arylformamidase
MFDPIELDRQYNARAAIPDHMEYIVRWRADSERVRKSFPAEIDLSYGKSSAERLDVFHAVNPDAPLLIFIHGGYWRSLDKSDFSFLAPAFVDRNVNVALVNYGLAPTTSMEEIVRHLLRAVTWLHQHASELRIDPRRIVISGHSAGGHLAAMMAAADWPAWESSLPDRVVRGIVCISGLYDLVPLAQAPFLKDAIKLDAAGARRLSPVTYSPKVSVPMLTAVGGDESAEFHRQNELITTSWPHCFRRNVPLPGRHHFSAVEALGDANHPLFHSTVELLGSYS